MTSDQLRLQSEHIAFVVVDGDCALCSASARRIAKLDRKDVVKICTSRGDIGGTLMKMAGLDPNDPTSWMVLHKGKIHTHMDAVIYLGTALGGLAGAARLLRLIPKPIRDRLYLVVARNRIKWFGQRDICSLPDPTLKAKLLD